MLCLLERLPVFDDLKFEISNLKSRAEGVSRQSSINAVGNAVAGGIGAAVALGGKKKTSP